MGMFDFLKKKKEESFEMPAEPFAQPHPPFQQMEMPQSAGLTEPPGQAPSFDQQFSPSFQPSLPSQPQAFRESAQQTGDQQLQLISAKLDTIKAQLETVLQRLDRLERKDESAYQQRWRTSM